MIREIKEINLPSYATLCKATVEYKDMAEKTITSQVSIDGQIHPDFSFDWEVHHMGEKFIMPLRTPQSSKDNTSWSSKIDLTFQHWAIYQLKRWYFFTLQSYNAGVAVADKYIASVSLNLKNFCDLYGQMLNHYFGDKITIDLNPDWEYAEEPIYININYSYLWNVLIELYKLFGVRWEIVPNGDPDHYTIKVGYPVKEMNHIFEYGFEGGLLKVERQVQDDNIRNMLLGRGGDKNIPPLYFKKADSSNPTFQEDPDWVEELANVYFDRLRSAEFRSYVQGWKAKHISKYPGYTSVGENNAVVPWAYRKGYTDTKFDPVEYVKDDESIRKYGELMGGLDNNDDIYPSIQGVVIDPYGRIDQVVDVEQVTDNNLDEDKQNEVDTWEESYPDFTYDFEIESNQRKTIVVTSETWKFDVPQGYVANIQNPTYVKSMFYPIWLGTLDSYPGDIGNLLNIEKVSIVALDNAGKEVSASAIPFGSYQIAFKFDLHNTNNNTTYYNQKAHITLSNVSIQFGLALENQKNQATFDIWIKNIWQTTKLSSETSEQYAERVWKPILGDHLGNEAAVCFSSGLLSLSEDYEFLIRGKAITNGIHYDTSKNLNGVQSHWRLTLIRSTADYDSLGKLVPNLEQQGKKGDYFYFTGIELTHYYVKWAEKRLHDYKLDQLSKVSDIQPSWVVSLDKVRIGTPHYEETQSLLSQLHIGGSVRIADKRFIGGSEQLYLYLQQITYKYNENANTANLTPDTEVVLGTDYQTTANPVATIQSQIDAIHNQLGGYSMSNIQQIVRMVGDRIYLRKDGITDRSQSITYFAQLLAALGFRQGMIGGYGWGIYQDENGKWVIETDRVNVRDEMQVNSLVINQIQARGGMIVESTASIEVSKVEDTTQGYKVYFDTKNGSVGNLFEIDDVAYCHRYTRENDDLKYYKRKVIETGEDYIVLSKTISNGQSVPSEGDVIVQYGNYTNKERQYVIIRDMIGGGYERMLSGLDSVTATGEEYYFAGYQSSTGERFFIGTRKDNQYIEYINGKLYIPGQLILGSSVDGGKTMLDYIKENGGLSKEEIEGIAKEQAKAEADKAQKEAKEYADAVAKAVGDDLQNQIDGKIETWFGDGEPSLQRDGYPMREWEEEGRDWNDIFEAHSGDLYYDNETGYAYRFSKENGQWTWITITDEAITKALAAAKEKKRIFTDTPKPPYDLNDLWVNATYKDATHDYKDDILVCKKAKESGTFAISDWGLASDYTNDDYAHTFDYLSKALNDGRTEIGGGLILSSLIALGTWDGSFQTIYSGINGLPLTAKDDPDYIKKGLGIAAWYGGDMLDKAFPSANPTGLERYATSLFRFDGSGYLANNLIGWNSDGSGWLAGENITWKANGSITFGNGITLGSSDKTVGDVGGLFTTVESLFQLVNNFSNYLIPMVKDAKGNLVESNWGLITKDNPLVAIKSIKGFYSDEFISAKGINAEADSTGGKSYLYDLLDVNNAAVKNPSAGQALVFRNGKWTAETIQAGGLDINTLESYLSGKGYATERWVENKNYLTSSSLVGYLLKTTADGLYQPKGDYALASQLSAYLTIDTAANTYVKKSGDIMSGALSISSADALKLTNTTANYFGYKGILAFYYGTERPTNTVQDEVMLRLRGSDKVIDSGGNNKVSLGASSWRWSNLYSVYGNFSDSITIGKITIEYDEDKEGLHIKGGGLYSDSYISAKGVNAEGGESGSTGATYLYNLLDVDKSSVMNPKSGQVLKYNGTKWTAGEAGLNTTDLAAYLTTNNYAKKSDIPTTIAWGNVTGKPSWIGASKPLYNWSEIGSKPTTLSGYEITDAYTKTDADSTFVKKSGDTMTGILSFSQPYAYIQSKNENGWICFMPFEYQNSLDAVLRINFSERTIDGGTNNATSLGVSSRRWSNLYSVLGNFSGLITANGGVAIPSTASIKIGDCVITWDGTGLKFSKGIYSEEFVSAKGTNQEGGNGGTTGIDIDALWRLLGASTNEQIAHSHLTTALLEYAKKTDIPSLDGYATQKWVSEQGYLKSVAWGDVTGKPSWIKSTAPAFTDLSSHPTTLAGYGITDAITAESANALFVKKSGDTMTGGLTINSTLSVTGSTTLGTRVYGQDGRSYMWHSTDGATVFGDINPTERNIIIRGLNIGMQNAVGTYFFYASSGNIGIGTSVPSYKLHVIGTSYFSQLLTANGGVLVPVSKSIKIGDCEITWDSASNGLKFSKGIYSEEWVSAKGVNSDGSSGGFGQYLTLNITGYIPQTIKYNGSNEVTASIAVPNNTNQLANGAGFITSSSLNGYATQDWVRGLGYANASQLSSYVLKGGDTMTGMLTNSARNAIKLTASNSYLWNTGTAFCIHFGEEAPVNTVDSGVMMRFRYEAGTIDCGFNDYTLGDTTCRWGGVYAKLINSSGDITGASFIKTGGTSSQFLKADGSVDSNSYSTVANTVTALGTSGNYLTWTKGGTTTNITVPYATNADTLDNLHETSFMRRFTSNVNSATDVTNLYRSCGYVLNSNEMLSTPNNGPFISFGNASYHKVLWGAYNSNELRLRTNNNGTWSEWRVFAFEDSNVHSATQLQNTRTIWGRPFNGTQDVSGDMTNVGSINLSYLLRFYKEIGNSQYLEVNSDGRLNFCTTTDNSYRNYSAYLTWEGDLWVRSSIKIGDATISWDGSALKVDKGLYSEKFISAKGVNSESGGGGGFGKYLTLTFNGGQKVSYNGSAEVTANITFPTALSGFTNDLGFITASALNGYALQSWVQGNYVTLNTAQTIAGQKTFNGNIVMGTNHYVYGVNETYGALLYFDGARTVIGSMGDSTTGNTRIRSKTDTIEAYSQSSATAYTILHTGNIGGANAGSATRLQNSQDIWGKPFDGTSSISGNMTGVGTIFGADGRRYIWTSGDFTMIGDATTVEHTILARGVSVLLQSSVGAYDLFVNDNKVGIGTSSPSYKLHVNGTLYATGASRLYGDVSVGTTTILEGYLFTRKHLFVGNANLFFDNTGNGTGTGIYFAPQSDGSLVVASHSARSWVRSGFQFYYDGTFYASQSITVGSSTSGSVKIGDATISWDNINKCLKIDKGLYSDSFISAKGTSDTIGDTTINLTSISSNVNPSKNAVYSFGNSGMRWNGLYAVSGNFSSAVLQNTSDLRLKTDIDTDVDCIGILLKLGNVFKYRYNGLAVSERNWLDSETLHTGIAYQNAVRAMIPDFTGTDEQGYGYVNFLSSDYQATLLGALIQTALLQKSIQNDVNALKERIRQLEERVAELESA